MGDKESLKPRDFVQLLRREDFGPDYQQLCNAIVNPAHPALREQADSDASLYRIISTAVGNMLTKNGKGIFNCPDPHDWLSSILREIDDMEKRLQTGGSMEVN